MLINDGLDLMGQVVASGHDPADIRYRALVNWQAAYAAELCRRAVTRLFVGSGAHALYEPNPLQTAFRNVHAGAQHGVLDFDIAGEQYGRMRLETT